jgi:hypothetical protein
MPAFVPAEGEVLGHLHWLSFELGGLDVEAKAQTRGTPLRQAGDEALDHDVAAFEHRRQRIGEAQ